MPYLSKKALSQFLRTNCLRRLRLDLSPDNNTYRHEREAANMPPKQPPRPGLYHLTQEGREWEAEKVSELADTFGLEHVIGNNSRTPSGQTSYNKCELSDIIINASEGTFLIETEFDIEGSFKSALGISDYETKYSLDYSRLRPDIIEVLPPQMHDRYIQPDGQKSTLPEDDTRLQLRVIDIKLTSEPSASYFAEVTYYSMALAGWIIDHNLNDQFVVVLNAAIWPGSHSRSNLNLECRRIQDEERREPTYQELRDALEKDLEITPFEVFAPRVRHFFQKDVSYVLSIKNWGELDWHVDNRCMGCDYLGHQWYDQNGNPTWHPLHCIPTAKNTNHLSRIAAISRGAKVSLIEQGIQDVQSLANQDPSGVVYNSHQSLKAKRYVVNERAHSLLNGKAKVSKESGTSAIMPRWADLRIYITVDFDIGSAITFSMGIKAFWIEPYQNDIVREKQSFAPHSFIIDNKDVETERRELIAFLHYINDILVWVSNRDEERRNERGTNTNRSKFQVYIWDSVRYNHLIRVIGRHLDEILNDDSISHLAWLFPPEEILPNPNLSSTRSPITIVKSVIQSILAVPIPHYYSLFSVARNYHEESLPDHLADFRVSPLFEDPLSDQIPSERAHDIWTKAPNWSDRQVELVQTVRSQLRALETVTKRLETQLSPILINDATELTVAQGSRRISAIQGPIRRNGISYDGQLWYSYAKLDVALQKLELFQNRAMPIHERESRFISARLMRRLTGFEEEKALARLGISPTLGRRVYLLNEDSREVKAREGDFLFAIAPEGLPNFLNQKFIHHIRGTRLDSGNPEWQTRMEDVTQVTVVAIDREACLIAIDPNRNHTILDDLEELNIADFSENVVLDPIFKDYFSRKLEKVLRAIGNPEIARNDSHVRKAIASTSGRGARRTNITPPAGFLWSANLLSESEIYRNLDQVHEHLINLGVSLNDSQWIAWRRALSSRLHLIWGPPGTGKSLTLRSIVLGAIIDAHISQKPLRILITAGTYNALDNVLLGLFDKSAINDYLSNIPNLHTYRIRSSFKPQLIDFADSINDIVLNQTNPSCDLMLQNLINNDKICVVGATPQQVFRLLTLGDGSPVQSFFDLIILDEASQMDVGNAILSISSITEQGSLIVAGDPLQLPPIHKAKPPHDLEYMVGSIYDFYKKNPGVNESTLNINYRSNATIVNFTHEAGYDGSLTSYSPDLRLNIIKELPSGEIPDNWPDVLFWTPEWSFMLDPDYPLTCFTYQDGRSGQWNKFEADAIASLVHLLYERLGKQLHQECDPKTGTYYNSDNTVMDEKMFWESGVGIVTPHKAQQALIINRLQQIFPNTPKNYIRNAVDTVERFQGQQRHVIIASFALGDEDAINDEDEFLLGLNRFNVMASRPRAKLITFLSEEVIKHLSNDIEVLKESKLLKIFADSGDNEEREMSLGYIDDNLEYEISGIFKFRQ